MFQKLLLITLLLSVNACSNFAYYLQSMQGQWDVIQRRESIQALLEKNDIPTDTKAVLRRALAIRDFASRELGLPDNGSFRSYANLERPYVVWNVFAAPALSLKPKQWCFLFAGCVSYRGYFTKEDAVQYGNELQAQGWDVFIAGIRAYSTLGWFDDPLLNTVTHYDEIALAALIFHEMAHQVVYVEDDTSFNESFAKTVEQVGVKRWMERKQNSAHYQKYLKRQQHSKEFIALVMKYRQKLKTVYDSPLYDDKKLEAKRRIFSELQKEYQALKQRWNNSKRYDRWFARDMNNAKLNSVGAYHEYVPGFKQMLARKDNTLESFYTAVKTLSRRPASERRQLLMQNNQ
ncbi:MAG: aminopeptidase [Gammaproteobacteria bacterium]|nr:MAG: aminopeptidase [Gammaproteobacteria bacterium]